MSRYRRWLRCCCQLPQLGTGTANANSTLIRQWPSSSHLCWMRSNTNKPGPLHRPTPKTPPSGIPPNMTGHRARAGCTVGCIARVADQVKAANAAKAGSTLKEEDRPHRQPSTSFHSYKQNRNAGRAAHPVPSKDKMSQFLKLKEEVVKWLQGYIQRNAKHITCSLTPDHKAVKC